MDFQSLSLDKQFSRVIEVSIQQWGTLEILSESVKGIWFKN